MNLVYISPHFPAHYSLFAERLAQRGVNVFGITDQSDEALGIPLREALTAHYRVDRFEEVGQVLVACEFFKNSFGPFERVESHLEPWLQLEAIIRDRYQLFGPKPEDLKYLKQKSLMKSVFEKARVPVARGVIVENPHQCLSFINHRFPAFIKPDIGVGASDTYTIRSEDDVRAFFSQKQDYPYFLEEYLDGVIESFDGLTDHDGNIIFFTSHVFSNDIHKIVVKNENLSYYSARQIPNDLEEYGRRVVEAAKIREKFFHIEFFRLPDDSLKALEINLRPPGGLTTHMFNYACDIDVYDWWARVVSGQNGDFTFSRIYHCAVVGRKFDRPYAFSNEDVYRQFGHRVVHSQNMNPIEARVMGDFAYLVRSPDLNEIREMVEFITREAH